MHQRRMFVRMGVRFGTVVCLIVLMLMMFVVPMGMTVDHPFVTVKMVMALCDMQPYSDRHHRAATQNRLPGRSDRMTSAVAAPKNGATEK